MVPFGTTLAQRGRRSIARGLPVLALDIGQGNRASTAGYVGKNERTSMSDEMTPPPPPNDLPLPPPPNGQELPPNPLRKPKGETESDRVQDQLTRQAGVAPSAQQATGSLLTEPVLVVNQKAKLIEVTAEFKVFNAAGQPVGSVVQVGQSTLKKVARFVSSVDQFMTHTYEVRDANEVPIMQLVRPAKFMKSKFRIQTPDGGLIGTVVQKNVFGKVRFGLFANDVEVGSLNAENWRAWNFNVQNTEGQQVARITKTFEGIAKTLFTTADNYVVQIDPSLSDPLRSIAICAALCVDTALKQDSRGFN